VTIFGGSGKELTMVAWMVPAVVLELPQFWPECMNEAQPISKATAVACSRNEPARPPPSGSPRLRLRVVERVAMVAA